jgi:uncharacterized membrane protein YidH (DUF202 family)
MRKKKKIIFSIVGFILIVGFLIARNSFLNFQEKREQQRQEQRMDNFGNSLIQDWQGSNKY